MRTQKLVRPCYQCGGRDSEIQKKFARLIRVQGPRYVKPGFAVSCAMTIHSSTVQATSLFYLAASHVLRNWQDPFIKLPQGLFNRHNSTTKIAASSTPAPRLDPNSPNL